MEHPVVGDEENAGVPPALSPKHGNRAGRPRAGTRSQLCAQAGIGGERHARHEGSRIGQIEEARVAQAVLLLKIPWPPLVWKKVPAA